MDGVQAFQRKLLVDFTKQRNVRLELLVEISDVDECSEELRREDQFEGLSVFVDRVEEPQSPQAVQLDLMLSLGVFHYVQTEDRGRKSFLLLLLENSFVFGEQGAVGYKRTANKVSSLQPYLGVDLVVEGQISQARQHKAQHL